MSKKSTQNSPFFENKTVFSIKDIGQTIQQARKAQKLTQHRLALLCGVTPKFLSELENGKHKHLSLLLVLKVLKSIGIELKLEQRKIK